MNGRRLNEGGRSKVRRPRSRLDTLRLLVIVVFIVLGGALFKVQIVDYGVYVALADDQQQVTQHLFPERGKILVRDDDGSLYPLAENQKEDLLFADPRSLANATDTVDKIKSILGLTDDQIPALLQQLQNKSKAYYPIQHRLTQAQSDAIKQLNIKGLALSPEPWRVYNEPTVTSNLLGFLGFDGDKKVGRYGIEQYWEKDLAGQEGYLSGMRAAGGSLIAAATNVFQPSQNGDDLVLTVNRALQYIACNALADSVSKWEAKSGALIVMNPQTGAVLALCSVPTFDSNHYNEVKSAEAYDNTALMTYEPGSVFKSITMAAALDTNAVTPQTTYEDTGQVQINGFTIKNAHEKVYGKQTMTDVLKLSINTGAIFAMRKTTAPVFARYVKDFGFGQPSGLELPRDNSGDISSLKKSGEVFAATATFGQGITVTPIQLAAAYSAIVNGGKLFKPYVVDEIIHPDGTVAATKPTLVRQLLKPGTSEAMKAMLTAVIEKPIHSAQISGYWVGGKTGTAQIAVPGGYSDTIADHTFAGFAPANNPAVVTIAKLQTPKADWAESSAAPLFQQVTAAALRILRVTPDRL